MNPILKHLDNQLEILKEYRDSYSQDEVEIIIKVIKREILQSMNRPRK